MIGFVLIGVLAVVALSAMAALAVNAADGHLRRRGAHVERRAVELAALLPILLALTLVGTLVVRALAGVDHCQAHDHHAHLCFTHDAGWGNHPWEIAVLAAALATVLARLAMLAFRHLRGARAITALRRTAVEIDDVQVVDSPRAFCFVAGVRRPRIYASTAAWDELAADERAAVLAHERGHVAHRDLRRRLALDVLLVLAAPLVGDGLVRRWTRATERLRDDHAARELGNPEPVARAMVRMCRLELGTATPGFQFAARSDELTYRVTSLLDGAPTGEVGARRLAAAGSFLVLALCTYLAFQVEPIHHALETLLG